MGKSLMFEMTGWAAEKTAKKKKPTIDDDDDEGAVGITLSPTLPSTGITLRPSGVVTGIVKTSPGTLRWDTLSTSSTTMGIDPTALKELEKEARNRMMREAEKVISHSLMTPAVAKISNICMHGLLRTLCRKGCK